jgi:hypothetical protein
MFNLFESKEDKELRKWKKSTLYQVMASETDKIFNKGGKLSNNSENRREEHKSDAFKAIYDAQHSDEPILNMRHLLINCVASSGRWFVPCFTEDDKDINDIFRDNPYISGKLHHKIRQIAEYEEVITDPDEKYLTDVQDKLQEMLWLKKDFTDADLKFYCNEQHTVCHYYLSLVNYLRVTLDDTIDMKDWYAPYYTGIMIIAEQTLRDKLGMKSLLSNPAEAILSMNMFTGLILSCVHNPYFEWSRKMDKLELDKLGL